MSTSGGFTAESMMIGHHRNFEMLNLVLARSSIFSTRDIENHTALIENILLLSYNIL